MARETLAHWGRLQAALISDQIYRGSWHTPHGEMVDSTTCVQAGSFSGRRLDQYQDVLYHAGAPNGLSYVRTNLPPNISVVDAGCSAGVALSDLRSLLPSAELHAIDVRNVLPFLITYEDLRNERVSEMFARQRIEFHQGSYLSVDRIVPFGYDLLFCVGAFFEVKEGGAIQQYALEKFYKGLKPRGIAQVLINTHPDSLEAIQNDFRQRNIPIAFHEGNPEVLKGHDLKFEKGITGTLTLGPKI